MKLFARLDTVVLYRRCATWCVAIAASAVLLSCESDAEPTFLKPCGFANRNVGVPQLCTQGMECTCGGCSVYCDTNDDCAPLSPLAVCARWVQNGWYCSNEREQGICTVPCASSNDCGALGSRYRCEERRCVLGAAEAGDAAVD